MRYWIVIGRPKSVAIAEGVSSGALALLGRCRKWSDFHGLDRAAREREPMAHMLIGQNCSTQVTHDLMHLHQHPPGLIRIKRNRLDRRIDLTPLLRPISADFFRPADEAAFKGLRPRYVRSHHSESGVNVSRVEGCVRGTEQSNFGRRLIWHKEMSRRRCCSATRHKISCGERGAQAQARRRATNRRRCAQGAARQLISGSDVRLCDSTGLTGSAYGRAAARTGEKLVRPLPASPAARARLLDNVSAVRRIVSMRRWFPSLVALALVAAAPSDGAQKSSALPYAISTPRPEYPIQAFRMRREGTAVLVLDVDPKTGNVGRVQLRRSTGTRQLDRLALKAATKWRFQPGTVTRLGVSVRFSPAGVFVGQDLVPDRPYPFAGTITAADARAKTITVRGARGTDVIAVGGETKFSRNGRPASLADVKAGSTVRGTAKVTSAPRALAVSVEIE